MLRFEALAPSNVEDLVDLLANVDPTHFAHTTRDAAASFLAAPRDVHVLGRSGALVVAFGMLRGWQEGYETPSLGIAVRTSLEGHGYGKAMMAELERLARARGARSVRLRVHPDNSRAILLYKACGYLEAGLERGEVLMVLSLQTQGPSGAG